MRTCIYIVLIIVLSTGCNKINSYKTIQEKLNNQILLNNTINYQYLQQFSSEGDTIDSQLVLSNINGDIIQLRDLQNIDNKLFFYFSDLSCGLCYDAQIEALNKYYSDFKDRLVILSSFLSKRDLYIYYKAMNIKYPLYIINRNLKIEAFKSENPFYFTLNSNYTLRTVYFPAESNSLLTDNYLKIILNRFLLTKN